MSQFTTIRRAGVAIFLIAALAACSQPEVSPVASETPVASASPSPEMSEGEVITPDMSDKPSASASASAEPAPAGELPADHPFNDAAAMIDSFSAGFEIFALGPMTEAEVDGETVFVSKSADGDAVVIVPSADGSTIDAVRIVDVNAANETDSPLLMWSMLVSAILPDDAEINTFINDEVFAAVESGESVEATEDFGPLSVTVTAFDGNDDVTITIERAD